MKNKIIVIFFSAFSILFFTPNISKADNLYSLGGVISEFSFTTYSKANPFPNTINYVGTINQLIVDDKYISNYSVCNFPGGCYNGAISYNFVSYLASYLASTGTSFKIKNGDGEIIDMSNLINLYDMNPNFAQNYYCELTFTTGHLKLNDTGANSNASYGKNCQSKTTNYKDLDVLNKVYYNVVNVRFTLTQAFINSLTFDNQNKYFIRIGAVDNFWYRYPTNTSIIWDYRSPEGLTGNPTGCLTNLNTCSQMFIEIKQDQLIYDYKVPSNAFGNCYGSPYNFPFDGYANCKDKKANQVIAISSCFSANFAPCGIVQDKAMNPSNPCLNVNSSYCAASPGNGGTSNKSDNPFEDPDNNYSGVNDPNYTGSPGSNPNNNTVNNNASTSNTVSNYDPNNPFNQFNNNNTSVVSGNNNSDEIRKPQNADSIIVNCILSANQPCGATPPALFADCGFSLTNPTSWVKCLFVPSTQQVYYLVANSHDAMVGSFIADVIKFVTRFFVPITHLQDYTYSCQGYHIDFNIGSSLQLPVGATFSMPHIDSYPFSTCDDENPLSPNHTKSYIANTWVLPIERMLIILAGVALIYSMLLKAFNLNSDILDRNSRFRMRFKRGNKE